MLNYSPSSILDHPTLSSPIHVAIDDTLHNMEDETGREENVPSGIFSLEDDVIVDGRSEEEGILLGRVLEHLSLDDYEHRDYERRKHERSLSRGTSRHEVEPTITQEGEAMMARDPSLVVHSSREASRHVLPSTNEVVSSIEEERSDHGH